MKKIEYFCDRCGKPVIDESKLIHVENVPYLYNREVRGGKGNPILYRDKDLLAFHEQDFCDKCHDVYTHWYLLCMNALAHVLKYGTLMDGMVDLKDINWGIKRGD